LRELDCIIVRQPYASLIAYGSKRWEFRSYNCKKRGVICIASSRGKPLKTGDPFLNSISGNFPRGFAARLIVFHGLASRITRKNAEGIVRRYPFPSHEHIEKAMQISGFKGKADPLVEELRGLRKCLVEGGFFSFQSEKKGPA